MNIIKFRLHLSRVAMHGMAVASFTTAAAILEVYYIVVSICMHANAALCVHAYTQV